MILLFSVLIYAKKLQLMPDFWKWYRPVDIWFLLYRDENSRRESYSLNCNEASDMNGRKTKRAEGKRE